MFKKFVKGIFLGMSIFSGLSFPIAFEYPYIYKDPRIMGMGGAFTAVGGNTSSLFYNPAGLGKIKKDAGFKVDLIGFTGSISEDACNFLQDFQDALDVGDRDGDGDDTDDQLKAVNEVLRKYRGKTLHYSLNTFPNVAKRFNRFSFGIGALRSTRFDAIPHQGFGNTGILSVDADIMYGGIGGFAYSFLGNKLSVGIGIKYFHRERVFKDFTARELIENENNLENYIEDEVRKSGSAISGDIGVIYTIPSLVYGIDTSLGISYMNIGVLDFGDAGKIPSTLNVGVALTKERKSRFLNKLTFAFDIVDITKNYEEDEDWGKRLRAGFELNVWNGKRSDFILRLGSYQGYLTAGAELRFAVIRAVFTTYAEEIGAYSGQDDNRRYMFSLYITW